IGVARARHAEFVALALAKILQAALRLAENLVRQRVHRPRFVIHAALQRAVRANERVERVPHIAIDRAGSVEGRVHQAVHSAHQQEFVLPQKLFRNRDIPIGKLIRIHRLWALVLARLLQIRAIERAVHGDLALGAAAERADVAVHAGEEAAGFPGTAYCARHSLSITGDTLCIEPISSSKWRSSTMTRTSRSGWAARSAGNR